MRSEGFLFIVWGLDSCSFRLLCARAVGVRRRASSRGASLIPCRWELRFERVACNCLWRCAVAIVVGFVAGATLCYGDCWGACYVGGVVLWGLLVGVSRGCLGGAVFWGLLRIVD